MTIDSGDKAGLVDEKEELLLLIRSMKRRLLEVVKEGSSSGPALSVKGAEMPVDPGCFMEERYSLEAVRENLGDCRRCDLYKSRNNIVFGEGNPRAALVFVGEAPGGDEDRQGRPFVGRAGALLTRIIEAMGMKREDVYICNILKCRPPGNRNPLPAEIDACEPFLRDQLRAIKPKVICALGAYAASTLLKKNAPITVMRGTFHVYEGIPLMPTYHPAYLLRNAGAKKVVWEDMKRVMAKIKGEDSWSKE